MPARPVLKALETDRLILRRRNVDEAGVYRRLWMERDPRVPTHRRIDAEGRPTVEDIASEIRREREETRPGVLAAERKSAGDVIGYSGLVFHGNGAPDEPELAYDDLFHAVDVSMYEAKNAGRNLVLLREPQMSRPDPTSRTTALPLAIPTLPVRRRRLLQEED